MKDLSELIAADLSTLDWLQEAIETSPTNCSVLPPSAENKEVLLATQVSTNSIIGTLAYHTGGVLISNGLLRLLGSGSAPIPRTVSGWNEGRSDGLYLVADDIVGGFFAINGGALGGDIGKLYYWSPDDIYWEPLEIGYGEFVGAMLTGRTTKFYNELLWSGWEQDIGSLLPDHCFSFYPFLFSVEGSVDESYRAAVPIAEAYDTKFQMYDQLVKNDA